MESDHIFTREPSETDRPPAFRRPRIVPPVTWLAAAVLLIAAVGLCIWSFTGTIVRSVDITGQNVYEIELPDGVNGVEPTWSPRLP